tara:strand:- start:291 stop:869 length:579 start_codon:yes stop_codon:yes gene_type:complete
MKIGIVPTIREVYRDQFELSVDLKLFKFFSKIYKNCEFVILAYPKILNFDLLCLSGGNDILESNKKKLNIRNKLDNYYYKKAKDKKIPIIGICHGAQFIAKKEGGNIVYLKQKIKAHKIYSKKIKYLNCKVNSYHNLVIKDLPNKFETLAVDKNNFTECFRIKSSKVLGIIWHPERYKNIKYSDSRLIKEFL